MLRKLLLNSKSISGVRLMMGRTVEVQKCLSYTAATYGEVKSTDSASPRYKCTTRVSPIRLGIECRIENFSSLLDFSHRDMTVWSEGVASPQLPQAEWKLQVRPNDGIDNNANCHSTLFRLHFTGPMADNKESINAAYKLFLVPESLPNHKIVLKQGAGVFEDTKYSAAPISFSAAKLTVKKALHKDGSLLVGAEIDMYHPPTAEVEEYSGVDAVAAVEEENSEADAAEEENSGVDAAASDSCVPQPESHSEAEDIEVSQAIKSKRSHCDDVLASLLDSGLLSDCRIVVGAESIRVHKNILAASSPFFKAGFDAEAEEQKHGKLLCTGYSPQAVHAMLSFIYTGQVDWARYAKDGGVGADLLALAEECKLPGLKTHVKEHFLLH